MFSVGSLFVATSLPAKPTRTELENLRHHPCMERASVADSLLALTLLVIGILALRTTVFSNFMPTSVGYTLVGAGGLNICMLTIVTLVSFILAGTGNVRNRGCADTGQKLMSCFGHP